MMHSNLTRWIEDADAKEVFLQNASMCEPQKISQHENIHLAQTITKALAWWHRASEHMLFRDHGQNVTRH